MDRLREVILRERYFWQADKTEEDVCWRIAKTLGADSSEEKKFFSLLREYRFAPNSPVFFNAPGTKTPFMGAACFVIPVQDSLKSIMQSAHNMSVIFKYGGGVGIAIDPLRPRGALVSDGSGYASGPVSFMHIYNEVASQVVQGGRRRAALLVCCDWRHPDIEEFIRCKRGDDLQAMNISVKLDGEFFNALAEGREVPVEMKGVRKVLNSEQINKEIVEGMWYNGEPGVLFIDTINYFNPFPHMPIRSTNPCGEQPLPDWGLCNLGSINLAHPDCIKGGTIDTSYIREVSYQSTLFLNRVLDLFKAPLRPIARFAINCRNIGLGVTGFAELLVKLGIPYASSQCMSVIDQIGEALLEGAILASVDEAKKKGPFPMFEKSRWNTNEISRLIPSRDASLIRKVLTHGLRNGALTCIAPTGTVSLWLRTVTTGVEPIFLNAYERKALTRSGEAVTDVLSLVPPNVNVSDVISNGGTLRGLPLDEHTKLVYRSALEISPQEHVDVLARWQKWTHAGVSKTINIPYEFTQDQLSGLVRYAYEQGCKGLTVYRDRSREDQVLRAVKDRPNVVRGNTYKLRAGTHPVYLTVNSWGGAPREIFINVGHSGNEIHALCSALGRVISIGLQHDTQLAPKIVATLRDHVGDLRGVVNFGNKGMVFESISDLVSKVLEYELSQCGSSLELPTPLRVCPSCTSTNLIVEVGCVTCQQCGWTKCS